MSEFKCDRCGANANGRPAPNIAVGDWVMRVGDKLIGIGYWKDFTVIPIGRLYEVRYVDNDAITIEVLGSNGTTVFIYGVWAGNFRKVVTESILK